MNALIIINFTAQPRHHKSNASTKAFLHSLEGLITRFLSLYSAPRNLVLFIRQALVACVFGGAVFPPL
jgi:hypothetical protein